MTRSPNFVRGRRIQPHPHGLRDCRWSQGPVHPVPERTCGPIQRETFGPHNSIYKIFVPCVAGQSKLSTPTQGLTKRLMYLRFGDRLSPIVELVSSIGVTAGTMHQAIVNLLTIGAVQASRVSARVPRPSYRIMAASGAKQDWDR
jgi:hypothetical protein